MLDIKQTFTFSGGPTNTGAMLAEHTASTHSFFYMCPATVAGATCDRTNHGAQPASDSSAFELFFGREEPQNGYHLLLLCVYFVYTYGDSGKKQPPYFIHAISPVLDRTTGLNYVRPRI